MDGGGGESEFIHLTYLYTSYYCLVSIKKNGFVVQFGKMKTKILNDYVVFV